MKKRHLLCLILPLFCSACATLTEQEMNDLVNIGTRVAVRKIVEAAK